MSDREASRGSASRRAILASAATGALGFGVGVATGRRPETESQSGTERREPVAAPQCARRLSHWPQGPNPNDDPGYFPIGVWLQEPGRAGDYAAAGINLYVGLWEGPTTTQLDELKAHKMPTICAFNKELADRPEIVGWLLPDEPDNAQYDPAADGGKGGYTTFIPPETLIKDAQMWRRENPDRPVLLNLGRGVAEWTWVGHGEGFSSDLYWSYARAADILSFDVYPSSQGVPQWYPAKGVDQLRALDHAKPAWVVVETGPINEANKKPTPAQVRFQVWSSLIHGAQGIVYFCHFFTEPLNDHWWLENPEMRAAITALNAEIKGLAPVLNSTALLPPAVLADGSAVIDVAARRHEGKTYLFAANMREQSARVSIEASGSTIEVIGEDRTLASRSGAFEDAFEPHQVHLYAVTD